MFQILETKVTVKYVEKERAGCFTSIVIRLSVLCLFLAVPLAGLQSVIVAIPAQSNFITFKCLLTLVGKTQTSHLS